MSITVSCDVCGESGVVPLGLSLALAIFLGVPFAASTLSAEPSSSGGPAGSSWRPGTQLHQETASDGSAVRASVVRLEGQDTRDFGVLAPTVASQPLARTSPSEHRGCASQEEACRVADRPRPDPSPGSPSWTRELAGTRLASSQPACSSEASSAVGDRPAASGARSAYASDRLGHESPPWRLRSGLLVVTGHNPTTIVAPEPYVPPVLAPCERIAAAMRAQGFSEEATRIGTGIVMAESGGRAEATNISEVERSVGPWQVNALVHRAYSDECLRSLACSTAVAWRLSAAGTRWVPWSAYVSGAYLGRCG